WQYRRIFDIVPSFLISQVQLLVDLGSKDRHVVIPLGISRISRFPGRSHVGETFDKLVSIALYVDSDEQLIPWRQNCRAPEHEPVIASAWRTRFREIDSRQVSVDEFEAQRNNGWSIGDASALRELPLGRSA